MTVLDIDSESVANIDPAVFTAPDSGERHTVCPVCGDPWIGGPGCYAGACAADPEGARP